MFIGFYFKQSDQAAEEFFAWIVGSVGSAGNDGDMGMIPCVSYNPSSNAVVQSINADALLVPSV